MEYQRFGKHLLLERIATGGMAEVFKAKAFGVEGFEKVVAIKRILPHVASDKAFIEMFINEAKILSALSHSSVCQIFDLGQIENTYYITMEYVAGKSLEKILLLFRKHGRTMPLSMAAFIVSRVCEGLDYVYHKVGLGGEPLRIVHRDVSPHNILVGHEGTVKLIDFGIARAKVPHEDRPSTAQQLQGKFDYMSPEQVAGEQVDHRSDVFSVGTCLYELVTNQHPFTGSTEFNTLENIRKLNPPPPSTINPDVTPELDAMIVKAIEKLPSRRWDRTGDLMEALQRFIISKPPLFNATSLSQFMRRTFARDIEEERRKNETYASVKFEDQPAGEEAPTTPGLSEALLAEMAAMAKKDDQTAVDAAATVPAPTGRPSQPPAAPPAGRPSQPPAAPPAGRPSQPPAAPPAAQAAVRQPAMAKRTMMGMPAAGIAVPVAAPPAAPAPVPLPMAVPPGPPAQASPYARIQTSPPVAKPPLRTLPPPGPPPGAMRVPMRTMMGQPAAAAVPSPGPPPRRIPSGPMPVQQPPPQQVPVAWPQQQPPPQQIPVAWPQQQPPPQQVPVAWPQQQPPPQQIPVAWPQQQMPPAAPQAVVRPMEPAEPGKAATLMAFSAPETGEAKVIAIPARPAAPAIQTGGPAYGGGETDLDFDDDEAPTAVLDDKLAAIVRTLAGAQAVAQQKPSVPPPLPIQSEVDAAATRPGFGREFAAAPGEVYEVQPIARQPARWSPSTAPAAEAAPPRRSAVVLLLVLAAVILVAGVVGFLWIRGRGRATAPPAPDARIVATVVDAAPADTGAGVKPAPADAGGPGIAEATAKEAAAEAVAPTDAAVAAPEAAPVDVAPEATVVAVLGPDVGPTVEPPDAGPAVQDVEKPPPDEAPPPPPPDAGHRRDRAPSRDAEPRPDRAREAATRDAGPVGDMGKLSVISNPWSTVSIDGRPTGRRTPLVNYDLSPGIHRVCLKTEDGREHCTAVRIETGRTARVVHNF